MAMTITIAAIQNLGIIASSEGKNVQAWKVMVHIEGGEFAHAQISIPVHGVATSHDAKKIAISSLQRFLSQAYAMAKNDEVLEVR
jgi:hypothetical protein